MLSEGVTNDIDCFGGVRVIERLHLLHELLRANGSARLLGTVRLERGDYGRVFAEYAFAGVSFDFSFSRRKVLY